jgi:outer membrane protein TolC
MSKRKVKVSVLLNLIAILMLGTGSVCAETLKEGLVRISGEHPLMRAVNNNVGAAKEDIGKDQSAFYPRVSINTKLGYQDISRDIGTNGAYHPDEVSFGVNQLVWDFGVTKNAIIRARKNLNSEVLERAAQCANLMLSGIEAYLDLSKQQQNLKFAKQSVENVKHQVQLENARIENSKGNVADLLQAKIKLSSAQERYVAAEGGLSKSIARYQTVFGVDAVPESELLNLVQPVHAFPESLEEVLSLVIVSNYNVMVADSKAELMKASRDAVVSKELMPRIDWQADYIRRHEFDGIAGERIDTQVMLRMGWNYDIGQKARYVSDSASYLFEAEHQKSAYVVRQAQESARNAWSDLETARLRIESFRDQLNASKKFIELAREQRESGGRGLLDILDGEVNLFNAQAGLAAAERDAVLASYKVLHAVGNLDVDLLAYASN